MMMVRVEYTCSFLLVEGRKKKKKKHKDAESSVASRLQAAETRSRIKSFWVHGVSLLFGFSLNRCLHLFAGLCFCHLILLCKYLISLPCNTAF